MTASPLRVDPTTAAFDRFAGLGGLLTGISSLLYAVFFLLITGPLHEVLPSVFLAIGGFFALTVSVAVYRRVRDAEPNFALWALLLAGMGYLGTAVHGVYGLALLIPAKTAAPEASALSQTDPRGFLAFGVTGVSVLVFAWLIVRSGALPRLLGYVGYVLGVAVIALFLGTLLTNDLKSAYVLVPGAVASLLATPIWNIGLGLSLLRAAGR
jgi:hypothetical protein